MKSSAAVQACHILMICHKASLIKPAIMGTGKVIQTHNTEEPRSVPNFDRLIPPNRKLTPTLIMLRLLPQSHLTGTQSNRRISECAYTSEISQQIFRSTGFAIGFLVTTFLLVAKSVYKEVSSCDVHCDGVGSKVAIRSFRRGSSSRHGRHDILNLVSEPVASNQRSWQAISAKHSVHPKDHTNAMVVLPHIRRNRSSRPQPDCALSCR